MEEENKNTSIVKIEPGALERVSKQIAITNKLLKKFDKLQETSETVIIIDIAPFSLFYKHPVNGNYETIIEANTKLPVSKSITISITFENQSSFELNIYKDKKQIGSDNFLLGRIHIDNILVKPKETLEFEITFDVDKNGILNISVNDKQSGKKQNIRIQYFGDNRKRDENTETVTDIDGNIYQTVKIGEQVWMVENLNVSHFRNGDIIPEAKTDEEWREAGDKHQPAWCYYDNNSENGKIFGKLYNWYAVNDIRFICPDEWIIPVRIEDNNDSFNVLLGGNRNDDGIFGDIGIYGYWWIYIEYSYTWSRNMCFENNNEDRNYFSRSSGFSVRCIKSTSMFDELGRKYLFILAGK